MTCNSVPPFSVGPADGIQIWSLSAKRYLRVLPTPGEAPSVRFSFDGSHIFAADQTAIRQWDTRCWKKQWETQLRSNRSHLMALSPDGLRLAVVDGAQVKIWDLQDYSCINSLQRHPFRPLRKRTKDNCLVECIASVGTM